MAKCEENLYQKYNGKIVSTLLKDFPSDYVSTKDKFVTTADRDKHVQTLEYLHEFRRKSDRSMGEC